MISKNIQFYFLSIVTIVLLVLSFLVFKPYLGVIFLSSVLAISFYPVFLKNVELFSGRRKIASFATVCMIIICIIIPLTFLSTHLLKEAINFYNDIVFNNVDNILVGSSNTFLNKVQKIFSSSAFQNFDIDIKIYIKNILS